MWKNLLSVVMLYLTLCMGGQNKKTDSLYSLMKTALHDSVKYRIYMELGDYFQGNNSDTAAYFHKQAIRVSAGMKGLQGILNKAHALRALSWDYYNKGEYDKSSKMALQVLDLLHGVERGAVTDTAFRNRILSIKCAAYNIMGVTYAERGIHTKAIEYYFDALKINEQIGNRGGIASVLGNIGNIYYDQENYSKAIEYYLQALKINRETGNKRGEAVNLGNIANSYTEMKDFSKASHYYTQALEINREIGNKKSQAINLGNIGNVYFLQNQYTEALRYYFQALQINKEIDNKKSVAVNLGNIGYTYVRQQKYKEAEFFLKQAEQMHRQMGTLYALKDVCFSLSELYEKLHLYKKALYYRREHIKARDTLFSEENRKMSLLKEMQYDYEKEQIRREIEHQRELAEERARQEKQKFIIYVVAVGLGMVMFFLVVVWHRLLLARKQKRIIEQQKYLVEEQKKIVEKKNKDIMDSITYARRIQQNILPPLHKWQQQLPHSFVLYLPKDIVAGDFYWMEEMDNELYVAAADCTGHGVPGAMISVMCSNALSKAVKGERIKNTDEILNRVREIVIEKLASEEGVMDGMDICLVRIKTDRYSVQYSGANRPLYVVHQRELTEYKPDYQPIGYYEKSQAFTRQEIILSAGDMLYLTTDGYADQFGGAKGKKMGIRRLVELLKENAGIASSDKQYKHLFTFFQEWKAQGYQVDDVTVIGIKLL